ncbi:MAG: hypothetical protein OXE81_11100, partial [Gammaproteobacteria bacterium]|nr:hypothetical protein [Gammaproteobacteria bacterium]
RPLNPDGATNPYEATPPPTPVNLSALRGLHALLAPPQQRFRNRQSHHVALRARGRRHSTFKLAFLRVFTAYPRHQRIEIRAVFAGEPHV